MIASLPTSGLIGAAAAAVAPVADEGRGDALRRHEARHHGEIAARDGVGTELLTQAALGDDGAREDDKAARLLVEPMHDAQARQRSLADPALAPRDNFRHEIVQGRRQRLGGARSSRVRPDDEPLTYQRASRRQRDVRRDGEG